MEPKKILIIHLGALGDLMLSRPTLLCIRNHFKESEIHFLGAPYLVALIRKELDIKEIFNIEGKPLFNLFAGNIDFLQNYGLVVLFTRKKSPQWDFLFAKVPTWFIQTIPLQEDISAAIYQQNQLAQYGIKIRNQILPLNLPTITSLKSPKIDYCIHPGSGSKSKNWFPQYFAKVMAELPLKPGIIVGPADEAATEELLFIIENQYSSLYKKLTILKDLSLIELAHILRKVHFYLGNDSGISHLAAALGIPVFVVFGPTNPFVWKPFGEKVIVFNPNISCAPCNEEKRKNCKKRICLENIKPEEVLKQIKKVIQF